MPPKEKQNDFTFETVAVLCSALMTTNLSIGNKHYELMSALDGTRTANSFQHQFRAVLRRARELKAQNDTGDKTTPVKANARGTKAADGSKKAGTKKRGHSKEEGGSSEDDVLAGGDAAAADYEGGAMKRVKTEVDEGNWFADL